MMPLYEDPCFTFRFAEARIIPRVHLEGVGASEGGSTVKYDFIPIPDADVPQAVEPVFQHVLSTYASETNKKVSL